MRRTCTPTQTRSPSCSEHVRTERRLGVVLTRAGRASLGMIKPLTPGRRLPFRPVGRQCRAPVHVRRRERWNAGSVKTVMRSVGPGEAIQSIQTRVSLCKEIDSGRLEIR